MPPLKPRRYKPEEDDVDVGGEAIAYKLFPSGFVQFMYLGQKHHHKLKVNQTAKELVTDKVFRLSLPEGEDPLQQQ